MRLRGARGRRLQRQRSEKAERSFAHVCETGGGRRTWLWGIGKVCKRHLVAAMTHNLGIVMRRRPTLHVRYMISTIFALGSAIFFRIFSASRLIGVASISSRNGMLR